MNHRHFLFHTVIYTIFLPTLFQHSASPTPFHTPYTHPIEPNPLLTALLKSLADIVKQQRADARGNQAVARQAGVDAVAEVTERVEAGVAVGDDDGGLGGIERGGPLRDARVELLDRGVVEAQRDDEVDLSRGGRNVNGDSTIDRVIAQSVGGR